MTKTTSGKKPLALVIEDEIDIGNLIAEALKAADYDVEVIRDGRKALERLSETVPVLVMLDLRLPYVSGDEILRQIRNDERLTEALVVVVTAHSELAETAGDNADLVLLKPFDLAQLRELAKRLHPK